MLRRLVLFAPFVLLACSFDAAGTGDGVVVRDDTGTVPVEEHDTSVPDDTFVPPEEDAYVPPAETTPVFDVLDDGAETPLPGCSVAKLAEHDYLFCELEANWDQARTTCQIAGYDLAIVNDKPEHDWIVDKLKSKSRSKFHIGLSDRTTEGTFAWVDGTSASFTSWGMWEPNDFLWKEDCVITNKDGSWNDIDCGDKLNEGFICESK